MSRDLQLFVFLFRLSSKWSVHSFIIPNICLSFPALKAGVNRVLLRFHWWPFSKNNPRLFLGAKGKGWKIEWYGNISMGKFNPHGIKNFFLLKMIICEDIKIILPFTFLDWKLSKSLTKTSFSRSGSLTERTGVYPSKYLYIKEKKMNDKGFFLIPRYTFWIYIYVHDSHSWKTFLNEINELTQKLFRILFSNRWWLVIVPVIKVQYYWQFSVWLIRQGWGYSQWLLERRVIKPFLKTTKHALHLKWFLTFFYML